MTASTTTYHVIDDTTLRANRRVWATRFRNGSVAFAMLGAFGLTFTVDLGDQRADNKSAGRYVSVSTQKISVVVDL